MKYNMAYIVPFLTMNELFLDLYHQWSTNHVQGRPNIIYGYFMF